jgi:hypothetical protein
MDNPEHQLRDQVDAMRRWLLMNGAVVEPRGVICLAHPEVAIRDAEQARYPVRVPDQLAESIGGAEPLPGADRLPSLLDRIAGPRASGAGPAG